MNTITNDNGLLTDMDLPFPPETEYMDQEAEIKTIAPVMTSSPLLSEARFWSRIMKEHALFIRLGLPANQKKLIQQAIAFNRRFAALEKDLNRTSRLSKNLLNSLRRTVERFIQYKEKLLKLLTACRIPGNTLFPLLIAHITREARHFLALLNDPAPQNRITALLETHVFWLRIMKEHIEFVRHLLDPSERSLILQTEQFVATLSHLLETSRDFKSMALAHPSSFNTVRRFTDEVIIQITEVRNFKAAAYELLLRCEVLSIIPSPLLADHIRREADKFLDELAELKLQTPGAK